MARALRRTAYFPVPAAVSVIFVALPTFALAADTAQEVATAAQHAGFAAAGTKIEQVHMHLHHTVNCLVGPKGEGFDAKEANPCQKLGSGAIPDTAGANARGKLTTALAKAQSGLQSDDLAAARNAAAETQKALQ